MARKMNAKLIEDTVIEDRDLTTTQLAEVPTERKKSRVKKGMIPNIYTDIIQSLMEKNRARVSRYYCPNLSCKNTFWDSGKGYLCPECGAPGIISEYRHRMATDGTKDRNIVGYLDTMARLICGSCILKYGISNEVGLVVYDNMEPFCNETCDLCKEQLTSVE